LIWCHDQLASDAATVIIDDENILQAYHLYESYGGEPNCRVTAMMGFNIGIVSRFSFVPTKHKH
jgi:hypothetical protein